MEAEDFERGSEAVGEVTGEQQHSNDVMLVEEGERTETRETAEDRRPDGAEVTHNQENDGEQGEPAADPEPGREQSTPAEGEEGFEEKQNFPQNPDDQQNEDDQENWNNYGNPQYQWNGNYQWYPQQGGYYYSGGYGGDGPRRYNDYYYGGQRGGYRGNLPRPPRNNFRRPMSPNNTGYGNYRQSQSYHRYYDDSGENMNEGGPTEGGYRPTRGYQFSRYYHSDRGYQNDWHENNYGESDAANPEVACLLIIERF